MRKLFKYYFLVALIFFALFNSFEVKAQSASPTNPTTSPSPAASITSVKTGSVCIKVGNPTEPMPSACSTPIATTTATPQATSAPNQTTEKPPAPPPPEEIGQAIATQFGINISGFGTQQLQWTWEKLWEVSNTRFIALVRGTSVTVGPGTQTGCKSVNLPAIGTKDGFTVVLFHELGHIIRNCSPQADSGYQKHLEALFNEGSVSNYAKELCTYGSGEKSQWVRESEDYAETITYYLHPNASQQTVRCAGSGPNPYSDGSNNLHFDVAKSVLGDF